MFKHIEYSESEILDDWHFKKILSSVTISYILMRACNVSLIIIMDYIHLGKLSGSADSSRRVSAHTVRKMLS